jgi:hypothetical protein
MSALQVDARAYLDAVRISLRDNGFDLADSDLRGTAVLAGRRSDFRWRWLGVRLQTSVLVADLGFAGTAPSVLESFLQDATGWAVERGPGRMLGVQRGVAAIAAAVLPELTPAARTWASTPHGRSFAVIAFPVAIGLRTGEVVNPRRMVVGGVFSSFLKGVVSDVLVAPLRSAG